MTEHACFDCGTPIDGRVYRRAGHRMQVLTLCEACTARVAVDLAQTLGYWLEQGRTIRLLPTSPDCLTTKEAARRLRCSQSMIYKLINEGKLQKIGVGRKIAIPLASFERYMAGGAA